MKRSYLLLFLAIAIIGGLIGLYMFNEKVPTLDAVEADFIVTANELYNAFDENEEAALSQYQDKVLQVTGTVRRTKVDSNQFNVVLKASGSMTGGINCALRDLTVENPEKGSEITVKGRCQGYLMDVVLNNCVIVK
jgi:hypothetical protein